MRRNDYNQHKELDKEIESCDIMITNTDELTQLIRVFEDKVRNLKSIEVSSNTHRDRCRCSQSSIPHFGSPLSFLTSKVMFVTENEAESLMSINRSYERVFQALIDTCNVTWLTVTWDVVSCESKRRVPVAAHWRNQWFQKICPYDDNGSINDRKITCHENELFFNPIRCCTRNLLTQIGIRFISTTQNVYRYELYTFHVIRFLTRY